jgi:hypothetical protein
MTADTRFQTLAAELGHDFSGEINRFTPATSI